MGLVGLVLQRFESDLVHLVSFLELKLLGLTTVCLLGRLPLIGDLIILVDSHGDFVLRHTFRFGNGGC